MLLLKTIVEQCFANGHAYHDPKLGSKNTNFALLVSHTFSEPFNEPNEFAHEISRLANKLSNGSVIVQRYGDIKRGRRTTYKRLKKDIQSLLYQKQYLET